MEFSNSYLYKIYSISAILLTLFVWVGCRGKDNPEPGNTVDKAAIMSNIGEELILPRYDNMIIDFNALKASGDAFINSVDVSTLESLRVSFISAYKSWQHVSVFEFGPAESKTLKAIMNTFPTDTAQINSNMASGAYNLEAASNLDAIGFPAIDFLIYGTGTNSSEVVSYFSDSSLGQSRRQYLNDLLELMNSYFTEVQNGWLSSGGNYITTFKESQGTEAGSSISLLVNNLNKDFEIIKNARVGIPLGKKTLDVPLPYKTEAYYSGRSLELAIESLRSLKLLYAGISNSGVDGDGLDDYIKGLENEGVVQGLHDDIWSGFESIQTKMESIPDPLSDQIINNSSDVNDLYSLILQQLVRIKTDMPSAMGVLITYQDNDGD
tara:strand:- start:1662 stop:2801 length:1140 start_codon:yes stop_codon:yes gene_type:complete